MPSFRLVRDGELAPEPTCPVELEGLGAEFHRLTSGEQFWVCHSDSYLAQRVRRLMADLVSLDCDAHYYQVKNLTATLIEALRFVGTQQVYLPQTPAATVWLFVWMTLSASERKWIDVSWDMEASKIREDLSSRDGVPSREALEATYNAVVGGSADLMRLLPLYLKHSPNIRDAPDASLNVEPEWLGTSPMR